MNWAGFYVLDPSEQSQLILGPFHGKVACQTIAFKRGVCGAAAAAREVQLVPDVEQFPGHIACDGDSKSEIVVPIIKDGTVSFLRARVCRAALTKAYQVVAIIDVDCAVKNGFNEEDQRYLEELATLLSGACDW